MNFISTRNLNDVASSAEAIIRGLSNNGGLYVPEKFPDFSDELKMMQDLTYEELALKISKAFFLDLGEENLKKCVKNAYTGKFHVEIKNNYLELYHGPTAAFKDAALLFLPQLMRTAKKNLNIKDEILILTATSGDTGKAALEGFKDIEGIKVKVFYPKNGVSKIQEYQMLTQEGDNLSVISINGNFDDAQNGVKEIFSNEDFVKKLGKDGILISSANSINIGRLVPQIIYYFYGYFDLVNNKKIKNGEKINVVVPTGNFGNILASYYAKKMGLPIDKFICASNENNVLTDFINTSKYDKRRELILTESPSMDILVSSNLERFLFEISNRDDKCINKFMNNLSENGVYEINSKMKENMSDFYGYSADVAEIYKEINKVYKEKNYLIDTHTAVASVAYNKYLKEVKDEKEVLIASTASPFKFVRSMINALEIDKCDKYDDFEMLDVLAQYSNTEIPEGLKNLKNKKIKHDNNCDKNKMKEAILKEIGSR